MLQLAFLLYALNVAAGVAAQLGRVRLGRWHHALYAVVLASTLAALLTSFHGGLLLAAAALLLFPRARPHTPWHPALAAVGLLGHLAALLH